MIRISADEQADPERTGGRERAGGLRACISSREAPAMASIGTIMKKRPIHIATPSMQRYKGRAGGEPGKGRAVVPVAEREGVEDLGEAVRPLVERPASPLGHHRRERGEAKDHQRQHGDREHGELHFAALDLLADIFGRAADHQPGDEHREDGEQQEAVEPAPTPPTTISPSWMLNSGTSPPSGGEAVVHRIDRAAGSGGGHHREQSARRRCRSGLPCPPCCRRRATPDVVDRVAARLPASRRA